METRVVAIHPPRDLCPGAKRVPVAQCRPGAYEGAPVVSDSQIAALIAPRMEAASVRKQQRLGVQITGELTRGFRRESPLGNLFADLMRQAQKTDVGVTNSGGLRANIPVGPLTYGSLYEAMPFDNRFVTVTMKADDVARMLAESLRQSRGRLLVSGIRATASCHGDALTVELTDERKSHIPGDRELTVATSDFLAMGEKSTFGRLELPADAFQIHDTIVRERLAELLRERGGQLSGADKALSDPANPRVRHPGKRPVSCALEVGSSRRE